MFGWCQVIVFEWFQFKAWFHFNLVITGSFIRDQLACFSSKMSKYSWYSGGTICLSIKSSFFRFSATAMSVAKLVFEQIQTLFILGFIQVPSSIICSHILIKGEIRASQQSVPRTLTVCVIHLSGSSSLVTVVFGRGFAKRSSICFLKFIFWGVCCHSNVLVCQLIIGLCFCSQAKPKIIFCFPNPVMYQYCIICFCPKISRSKLM